MTAAVLDRCGMGDRDRCINIPGTPAPRTSPTWSSASLSAQSSSSSITAARRAARSAASRVRATTPWAEPGSRFTAFLEAVVIDRPNGASESPNARIQRIKRMACGYRNRERFRDVISLRLAGVELRPRPVSALSMSGSAAILLSEKCSTESDISRVGRTARDPRRHLRWWLRLRRRSDVRRRPVPDRPPHADVPRVECARDGVSQAATPWTDPGSRFTAFREAVVIDRPNELVESTNARIQRIKRMVCGYQNRERFGNAIPFRLRGLDLHPRPVSTHTIA